MSEQTSAGSAKQRLNVVGAVIVQNHRVLAAQRGPGTTLAGHWEFPGGKIDSGESPAEALVREVQEELGCQIQVGEHVNTTTHEYDFATIELATYYATVVSGMPTASEHAEIRWLRAADLPSLQWAPADLPAVTQIVRDASARL